MAFVVADRVKETTTTVGTGAVALAGAVTGFRTFASGIGNSNTTYYTIAHQTANEWEVGFGTLDSTSANLARTTVLASSNSGSLVTFSAGTKDVFVTQSAARTLVQASGGTTTNGVLYYTGSGVATGGSALTFDGTTLNTTGNITLNGSQVLAASNYNSYAPTLTGTGASGTWGINVTGTSGSISGFNNPTTAATANTIAYRDSGGDIYQRYSFAVHFNQSSGNTENPSIAAFWTNSASDNYNRKSSPAHVISQLGLLTTSNYNSYAPTLTGTGASGTWSINVTGSAGSASSATNATNLYGAAGYIQSTTTGTSYSNAYQVREALGGSGNTSAIYTPRLAWHWSGVVASSIGMEASGRIAIFNNPGTSYENLVCNQFQSDRTYGLTDIRSPIFYDYNDTGYYVDPNNVSFLNNLIVNGGAVSNNNNGLRNVMPTGGSYVTGSSSVSGAIVITLPQTVYPMIKFRVSVYTYDGLSFDIYCGGHTSSGLWYYTFAYMGTQNRSPLNVRFTYGSGLMYVYIGELGSVWSYPQVFITDVQVGYTNYEYDRWDNGWTISFNSSTYNNILSTHLVNPPPQSTSNYSAIYAPILYDYNDTGYYVDPASTSNINAMTGVGNWYTSAYVGSTVVHIRGDSLEDRTSASDSGAVVVNYYGYQVGTTYYRNFIVYDGKGSPRLTTYGSGNYTQATGSLRAPLFYDSDNTSFYLDPNSGSNLNTITVNNWIYSNGAVGWYNNTYGGGIYMNDATYVRVYASKAFLVENTIQHQTAGGVAEAFKAVNTTSATTTQSIIRFSRTTAPTGIGSFYGGMVDWIQTKPDAVTTSTAQIFARNSMFGGINNTIATGFLYLKANSVNTSNVEFNSVQLALNGSYSGTGSFTVSGYDGAVAAETTWYTLAPTNLRPQTDNYASLGVSSLRWTVVYATTGTINTSDRTQKDEIRDLETAEKAVAVRIKSLFKAFKFKDAIQKKGDNARIHVGVIAQDVRDAFIAEGLDPNRYALFCSDTFKVVNDVPVDRDEVTNEYPADAVDKTVLGVRYDELLAFVISAI